LFVFLLYTVHIVIFIFRKNVTGLFGIVTGDFWNVNGHFGDVTDGPSAVP